MESFDFDVVSCCGFIDVEKSASFDHLKPVFKKYKFSSLYEQSVQRKKFSQNYCETKHTKSYF